MTLLPEVFKTGALSPVIKLSSTYVLPEVTVPSTATLSPALQTKVSPVDTSSMVTSVSFSPSFKIAFEGVICTNLRMALFV